MCALGNLSVQYIFSLVLYYLKVENCREKLVFEKKDENWNGKISTQMEKGESEIIEIKGRNRSRKDRSNARWEG